MNRTVLRQPWCRPGVARSIYSPAVSLPRRTFSAHSIYWDGWSRWEKPKAKNTRPNDPEDILASPITPHHVPWYLQGEEQVLVSEPEISPRQLIPDLPEDPPYILPQLLQYCAQDIALLDLNMLDLRPMETPSALGANVIMIFGTARSVKHLNTAADRLSRWLRGFWGLQPHADGLMGRGELILKIRRMARRARIASRRGLEYEETESDQHPGWICVNVGNVDDSPIVKRKIQEESKGSSTKEGGVPTAEKKPVRKSQASESKASEPGAQGFEGFGNPVVGTRIVIQLFTEEKRAEVDLDHLWEKRLERDLRAQGVSDAEIDLQRLNRVLSTAPQLEVRSSTSTTPSPSASDRHGLPTRTPVNLTIDKRREIHTRRPRIMSQAIHNAANKSVASPFRSSVRCYSTSERSPSDIVDFLLHYLTDLSDQRVKTDLGTGSDDTSSTPFLQLFHENLSNLSGEEEAFAKLKLHCVATHRHHPGYSKQSLADAFEYYSALAIPISGDLSHEIISALLVGQRIEEPDGTTKETLPGEDIELALKIIAHLSTQGMNVLNMKMFNIIYKAALIIPDRRQLAAEPLKSARDMQMNQALFRITRMIDAFDFPFDHEQTRLHMILRFRAKDYDGFWKLWHKLPVMDFSRTSADYEMLFTLHRDLGDAAKAEKCLTEWLPMMAREDPPVVLEGTLLSVVFNCIYLVDPDVKAKFQKNTRNNITYLWIKCTEKRQEELKRQKEEDAMKQLMADGTK